MDRVVSSYTPTLAALRHARRRHLANTPLSSGRSLIVAMPTTPGVPGLLANVADETRMLAERLPGPILVDLPTTSEVLDLLPECAVAHFACHGVSDPVDPARSRLLLHDHETAPLTVSDVAALHLDGAHLAYLSACDTARTSDLRLIDEAIHLASAFQLAGYPHVIGTFWAIDDKIAVQIARSFYYEHQSVGAAKALHNAVRIVRDANPRTPSLWAAHHHAGA
jgi:CHAT domain-containing protein